MAHIDKHPPGAFCWIELGTTDQNAAKSFYTSLFGWSPQDFPMGPNQFYTMFKLDGGDAAAAFSISPEEQERGIPPHWMLYVCVANADDTASRVAGLGGKVIEGPFDVATFGRMAVLRDPTGTYINIWEPKSHVGTTVAGVDGTLCWADLNTPDPDRAGQFYTELFGWELMRGDDGYVHIKNNGEFIGGIPPVRQSSRETPPHWLPYFVTSSADETASKASAGGAKMYMPPTTMEKVGRIAVIADPQGAAFALYEAPQKA